MTFNYHFRVLEKEGAQVRLRIWITNPDVLAWGAKALPKNTRNLSNTPHFVALLLRQQCAQDDALMAAYREQVRKNDRATQRAIDAGKGGTLGDPMGETWMHMVALTKIASLKVENIVAFPAPKHAWDIPKTPAARAKYDAYWSSWLQTDALAEPPESLVHFDLTIVLKEAKWMPSQWPSGVKGTTAFASR